MDNLASKIYTGVVENNIDPKRMGRCRIKVFYLYNDIPKNNIPWSSPYIEPNGKSFQIPPIGKVVNVFFNDNNLYMPYYIYTDRYNLNLQDKLDSLSDEQYRNFNALLFDHRTRIYSDNESLMLDYKLNQIKIDDSSINLSLSSKRGRVNIGNEFSNQPAVLGNNFIMDWFLEFLRILINPVSLTGNIGAPVLKPELDAHITKFISNPRKFLSDYVYIADRIDKLERDSITTVVEHDDTKFVTPKDKK